MKLSKIFILIINKFLSKINGDLNADKYSIKIKMFQIVNLIEIKKIDKIYHIKTYLISSLDKKKYHSQMEEN